MTRLTLLYIVLLLTSYTVQAEADIKFVFTHEGSKFSKLIDEFSAREGIKIERVWEAQGDLRLSLLELIERGNAPDVVLIPGDHIGLHKLMNYSAIPLELRTENISDNIWQSATSDGQIYGAPIMQGNHLMLYYNKRYITEPAKT